MRVYREEEKSTDSNTNIFTAELVPSFKCDNCEFEGLSYKRLKTHMGKQRKIGVQVDGIDAETIIKNVNLETNNSLFIICQGEVAEDPDISVGETF